MLYVGNDVANDTHDCFICNSDGKILLMLSLFQTQRKDLMIFIKKILSLQMILRKIKVELETTRTLLIQSARVSS